MTDSIDIIDNPLEYGGKGQTWAPEFVAYMKAIVTHPVYKGMPDAINEKGKIQWEAPSNRSGGKYQFTHNKRRDWWKNKAKSIGIDTTKDQWISKTAKQIHPTGEKPCKRCGQVMKIAYVYPKANLINRFNNIFEDAFEISTQEPFTEVLQRAHDISEDKLFKNITSLLATKNLCIPNFKNDFDFLISWIENEYIATEPSVLSPGVMSNAPDRFDGFHSFNRCCRSKADTGRHEINLKSYTTDRRVFEFWSEGDWIAADRLMGLVKTKLKNEPTADGGVGPPTADHIGPLSLGFCHRPEFKLLSKAANSAKNNRMTLSDVRHLISCENLNIKVASWYSKPIWDLRKHDVNNDEKALRLSKILRDNQRIAMSILSGFFEAENYTFLVYLLELGYAERNVKFLNLRSFNFLTKYDSLLEEPRNTKYTIEQKARRIRLGMEALRSYKNKENRPSLEVSPEELARFAKEARTTIKHIPKAMKKRDCQLGKILFPPDGIISEELLRDFASNFPTNQIPLFEKVRNILIESMHVSGQSLSELWENDRYVREGFDL